VAGDAAQQLPPDDQAAWTEAMETLLSDDAQRQALASAGLNQAQQFSWQESARQLLKIYEQLLPTEK
jgi:glycosyltransferase involved in cell wall biosynthesis